MTPWSVYQTCVRRRWFPPHRGSGGVSRFTMDFQAYFTENRPLILFLYGQVFFVLGLAIFLQSRQRSRLQFRGFGTTPQKRSIQNLRYKLTPEGQKSSNLPGIETIKWWSRVSKKFLKGGMMTKSGNFSDF